MQALVEREMQYDERAEMENSLLNSYPKSLYAITP